MTSESQVNPNGFKKKLQIKIFFTQHMHSFKLNKKKKKKCFQIFFVLSQQIYPPIPPDVNDTFKSKRAADGK